MHKFPPTKTIAIDVDGTLHTHGTLNARVVEFCQAQKARGFTLMLWSARGKQYAQSVAQKFSVTHLFDDIVSKPGYVVDDQGWNWIKYTEVIRSLHQTIESQQTNYKLKNLKDYEEANRITDQLKASINQNSPD